MVEYILLLTGDVSFSRLRLSSYGRVAPCGVIAKEDRGVFS